MNKIIVPINWYNLFQGKKKVNSIQIYSFSVFNYTFLFYKFKFSINSFNHKKNVMKLYLK